GNREDAPASGDTSTFVDSLAPDSSATSPASSNSTTISVSYTAADAASGLDKVELWAKAPGATSFAKVATDSLPVSGGSFSYTASAGDGTYGFYTVAVDKAGNRESVPGSSDTTTLVDTTAPASSA